MDLVDLHRRTIAEFVARVPRQAGSDAWAAATPCPGWTVRDLVNHIVGEQRWAVPLLAGATIEEVGTDLDGDLLGDDPVGAVRHAGQAAGDAVAQPGVLASTVHLSFGDTPAEEYVRQLSADHLIHAWDLSVATGAPAQLPDELVGEVARWFADREDSYRGAGVIGPAVPVGPDASEQDRLLAAFGRRPDWSGGVE